MRWGEVLGLRWSDVDLDAGPAHHTDVDHDGCAAQGLPGLRVGDAQDEEGAPDGGAGPGECRRVTAAPDAPARGADSSRRQLADENLVVCKLDGTPLHPKNLSYEFGRAAKAADLPPIRLHDLRHPGPASRNPPSRSAGAPRPRQRVDHARHLLPRPRDADGRSQAGRRPGHRHGVVMVTIMDRSQPFVTTSVTSRPKTPLRRSPTTPLTCRNAVGLWLAVAGFRRESVDLR